MDLKITFGNIDRIKKFITDSLGKMSDENICDLNNKICEMLDILDGEAVKRELVDGNDDENEEVCGDCHMAGEKCGDCLVKDFEKGLNIKDD